jgi:cytoskeletal protein CcmA (bactofilin family)
MTEAVKAAGAGQPALLGSSITIKGEVYGSEDLTIEGQVEGKIELKDHNLTVGRQGRVKAQIHAKTVVIEGQVEGDVLAEERITMKETAHVSGDLLAPRVAISDGAQFRGSVDMSAAAEGRPAQQRPVLASAAER